MGAVGGGGEGVGLPVAGVDDDGDDDDEDDWVQSVLLASVGLGLLDILLEVSLKQNFWKSSHYCLPPQSHS